MPMAQTYYFLAASARFMGEDAVTEVLEERTRHYAGRNRTIDFWRICEPQFLEVPELARLGDRCPRPATAILSTDAQFIIWLKHRLQYVLTGQFDAPSQAIPDPLADRQAVR